MRPREVLGTAEIPDGDALTLVRRGEHFVILHDSYELMSTRMSGSEVALATLTHARLAARADSERSESHSLPPHWLIGGYGLGFTLRAALRVLGAEARLTVAELVPEVIQWARGPMAEVTAGCLDDPRVTLVEADVAEVIGQARGAFDAILLDVDNGPAGLVRYDNDRLYSEAGLRAATAALRPGGVLAVWSARPDHMFTYRLMRAGFAVEEAEVRGRGNGKGPRHVIWFATPRQ